MSEEEQRRDRELENLLGQFMVASFQSDKLAEMIYEKLPFGGSKEVRFVLPQRGLSPRSLVVTLKVEQSQAKPSKVERQSGDLKTLCVLESPSLEVDPQALREKTREMLEGSLQWWIGEGSYREMKLDEWKVNVSVIESRDTRRLSSMYTLLGNLEAKRKGDLTR